MSTRKFAAIATTVILFVGILWMGYGVVRRRTTPSYSASAAGSKAVFEKLRDDLQTRFPNGLARPPIEDTPGGVQFPDGVQIANYRLVIGVLFPPTDDDAIWLLRLATSHADPGVRASCMLSLGVLLSEGEPGQLLKSEVSVAWKDQVERALADAITGTNLLEKNAAIGSVCSGRLWKRELLANAIALQVGASDPNISLQLQSCLPEMDGWWKASGQARTSR